MKWLLAACLLLAALGCQQGKEPASQPAAAAGSGGERIISLPKAQVTEAYKNDIATLCDVVHLSEADQKPKDERWPLIAMWLGPHIKTDDGHEFLVAIQPLQGETKALALETEARRVGLSSCALAAEWRGQ